VDSTRLELITSAMRRQGRRFIAVHSDRCLGISRRTIPRGLLLDTFSDYILGSCYRRTRTKTTRSKGSILEFPVLVFSGRKVRRQSRKTSRNGARG
jgi:hypothetical protein